MYGLIVMLPQFYLKASVRRNYPPPITHPEFYYGFVGVTTVWQVMFLLISRDPFRYRPLMIPCVLEKLSFAIAVFILASQERVHSTLVIFGVIDLLLAVSFIVAYRLSRSEAVSPS